MIIQFSAANFRGLKEKAVIDFTASADKSLTECLISAGKKTVVPLIALFGENSSGKTTILNAFLTMREMVCGRYSHLYAGEKLPYEPFSDGGDSEPASFTAEYIYDGIRYMYSFTYNETRILEEILWYWPNGREALIFSRKDGEYLFRDNTFEQNALAGRTADNKLYLASSSEWNCSNTENAFRWFREQIICISPEEFKCSFAGDSTADSVLNVLDEIKFADSSVCDISFRTSDGNTSADVEYASAEGGKFTVPVERQSSGFRKYYTLIDAWIKAFSNGSLIILDELESGLGCRLTRHLVELVQSQEKNPNHAQLLCTTHDTYLMDQTLLRRDQMYITEKDTDTCSTFVAPVTCFSPRKDKRIDLGFLNGEFSLKNKQ